MDLDCLGTCHFGTAIGVLTMFFGVNLSEFLNCVLMDTV